MPNLINSNFLSLAYVRDKCKEWGYVDGQYQHSRSYLSRTNTTPTMTTMPLLLLPTVTTTISTTTITTT